MGELTDTEKELAGKIVKLRGKSGRPKITGGGMVGDLLNAISEHVPTNLVRAALVVFLGYHAWDYYARAQQMVADVEAKNAEARQAEVEADAINQKIGVDSASLAKVKAELTALQAAAQIAEADAKAQAQTIGNGTARLAMLRAEIDAAKNQAASVQAKVDALRQNINGMPLIVAQKKTRLRRRKSPLSKKSGTNTLRLKA
jgi:hypothetical protein